MTKREREEARIARLLPGGVPRWVRCYDNGGTDVPDGSIDRYTVVFTGRWAGKTRDWFPYLAMNAAPFHPQGFGQHGETQDHPCDVGDNGQWPRRLGRRCHLGVRIRFEDLPVDCRLLVKQDYIAYWGIDSVQAEDLRQAAATVPA